MGRDINSEASMNSVYLETFRKRKNELLASEIDFEENSVVSSGNMSVNSVYLEAFRRRKNKQLALELHLTVATSTEDVSTEETSTKETSTKEASTEEASAEKSSEDQPDSKKVLKAESKPKMENSNRGKVNRGRFQSGGRSTVPNNAKNSVVSDDLSRNNSNVPAKSMNTIARDSNTFSSGGEAEKAAIPSGSNSNIKSAHSKPVSKGNRANLSGWNKQEIAKVAIVLCLIVISICGFILILEMQTENNIIEVPDNTPVFSETESFPEYTDPTENNESTTADNTTAETTTAESSKTTATVESTTESVAKTTTTTAENELKALRPGVENDDVMRMQKRLAELGYITEQSCTGFYGEYTKKRLKIFQKNAGLKENGIASVETLKRLYAEDAPKH